MIVAVRERRHVHQLFEAGFGGNGRKAKPASSTGDKGGVWWRVSLNVLAR
jgi:hypothetical protein